MSEPKAGRDRRRERHLLRLVKGRVRASPALKAERKRLRAARSRSESGTGTFLLVGLVAAPWILGADLRGLAGGVSLCGVAATCFSAALFRASLFDPLVQQTLLFFPRPGRLAVEEAIRSVATRVLPLVFLFHASAYLRLDPHQAHLGADLVGAALQAATAVASGLLLVLFLTPWPFVRIGLLAAGLGIAVVALARGGHEDLSRLLETAARLMPPGQLGLFVSGEGGGASWAWATPSLVLVSSLPLVVPRLRARYEAWADPADALDPTDADDGVAPLAPSSEPSGEALEERRRRLRERLREGAPEPIDPASVASLLGPTRLLCLASIGSSSASYRSAALTWLLSILSLFLPIEGWIPFVGFFVLQAGALLAAAPQLMASLPVALISPRHVAPLHGLFPIPLGSMTEGILILAYARLLLWTPALAGAGLAYAWRERLPAATCLLVTARVTFILAASLPAALGVSLRSSVSAKRGAVEALRLLGIAVPGVLAFLGACGALLFLPFGWWWTAVAAALAAGSAGGLALSVRSIERWRVDLVRPLENR